MFSFSFHSNYRRAFLVEIELWQINDSPLAPKFNVVERPNDWAKTMKSAQGLTETKKLQFDFWQAYVEYAFSKSEYAAVFSRRKAQPQHWYDLGLGKAAYHCDLVVDTQKKRVGCGIYINDDKAIYKKFLEQRDIIEQSWGCKLDWVEAKKACRIIARHPGDIKQGKEKWMPLFDWLIDASLKAKKISDTFDA